MVKMFLKWQKKRTKQIEVILRKSGRLTTEQMMMGLQYSRDCLLMQTIEEIRARLEDEIMETAFNGNDSQRLTALSRLEGVNEFYKNLLEIRQAAEEKARQV
jgi:hypothetical protein